MKYYRLKQSKTGPNNPYERLNICAGNRYCVTPVCKVMICISTQYNSNGIELRWPVCEKHANAYYFKHLGAKVTFTILEDRDIDPNWNKVNLTSEGSSPIV